jgi:DNA-directed RNA polymerase specialized sigma24 family protein
MRRREADRRFVFAADLDRLDASRSLWAQGDGPDPPGSDLADALRDAIARQLTDKQREVVEAYFFEGASQGEIARRLGVTQQVVQKRLFGAPRGDKLVGGAIARLRRALQARASALTNEVGA